jgi:CBS domain-containing protein
MQSEPSALYHLTAAELMSTPVVTFAEDMPLKSAAARLAEAGISGVPVVDKLGRCVGVLSASDFVHGMGREQRSVPACAVAPASYGASPGINPDAVADGTVGDYMTRGAITVEENVRLGELARRMIDVHIHRLIVVDAHAKPVGIVSTTDILAAVVKCDPARRQRS